MTTAATVKPGIYPNMTYEEYAAIPAMNCTTLEWAAISAAHLDAAIRGELRKEDTSALGFGRAAHIRLLESDQYASRVVVKGDCGAVLASGKNKGQTCGNSGVGLVDGEWRCGAHGGDRSTLVRGVEYISADEAARVERVAEVLKTQRMDSLRRAPGEFEVVIVGELFGVPCKAKLDKLIRRPLTIVDVKTVQVGTTEREFTHRLDSYGYGFKAAFYCDLVKNVLGDMPRWYWLAVESDTPFRPAVYRASERCLTAGRNEYGGYLEMYKRGLDTGVWPGPSDEPVEIDGPSGWLQRNGV